MLFCALGGCLPIAACAPPEHGAAYVRAFAEGERAESAGRYADAALRYDEASRAARLARDRAHALHAAGLMRERAGDRAGARADFEALADAGPRSEEAALAAYEAARMAIDHGDGEAGWRAMESMLLRFPDDGVARSALHRLLAHEDETKSGGGTLALLARLEQTLGTTERGEEIAYEIALRLDREGKTREARDAFVALSVRWPYPHGTLFDDALYRASLLDERLGCYDEAIADLRKMLAVREASWFTGSYERPRFDAAQMRIAELYEERLHDDAHAVAELHKLYTDFRTSLLRDHALWKEAAILERGGDHRRHCERLAALVHDFPDSRYVPCAEARCPGVARPKTSKAPMACRHYLGGVEPDDSGGTP